MTVPSSAPTDVEFFFDPACPWTWITSRWLVEVADERDLQITWRPWSLEIQRGDDAPGPRQLHFHQSHRALRVMALLDAREGNDAVGRFYGQRGDHCFEREVIPDLEPVLEAAGLDPAFAAAADDPTLDDGIETAMAQARELAGDIGSPTIRLVERDIAFFGPVLTAMPDRDDALRLWDAYVAITAIPEFHELKRERRSGPVTPPHDRAHPG